MSSWYESAVDRKIREAQEQGEFDNLSGTGKQAATVLPDIDVDEVLRGWRQRRGRR